MGIRVGNIDIKRPILKLPPDLSEYYNTTNITGNWQTLIKKLPEFEIPATRKDLSSMFSGFKGTDIAYFDTSNVTGMSYIFAECSNLKTIPKLNTSNVTTMNYMFNNCTNLTEVPLLDTHNVTSMSSMFSGCRKLQTIPAFDTSNVTTMSYMFSSCTLLETIPQLDTSNVTSMSGMFNYCSKVKTIPQLNTSNVTSMSGMFTSCESLTEVPLLDTHNVTSMSSMFSGCRKLQTIPAFDTSNVTTMGEMFRACSGLVTLPEFDCGKVTNVGSMFFEHTSSYSWNLTNIGGFKDLGKAYLTTSSANYSSYTLDLQKGKSNRLTTVTYESLMNIINDLYDIASIGVQPQQLVLGPLKSKLSADEIAIATNKGWTVS